MFTFKVNVFPIFVLNSNSYVPAGIFPACNKTYFHSKIHKGCVKKNLLLGQSQFTARKRHLPTNFFLVLNGYIYSWFLSSENCFICSFSKYF